ncbi:hypothetical protein HH214_15455 [Mucilaginibacter robiniae]|uniref:PH domain-containing protein n=1 Tax=Mucilaginibacter robiniae TaxID=2728022 RepID=A0A7L5E3J9_9SPHI|nr:hypothetical protein [Mucilaginibacter robiniae]QJD97168.1 hypothetical protein HH214_15455 [Mucilaginibacter robiniae]
MTQLISKLQYKNFEKGEFCEEKSRYLEETMQLIRDFPWDQQRSLTDIQATGPSVTVKNQTGEYLKVGLFFNNKFCLYLLNQYHQVFEYHAPNLQSACDIVSKFYTGANLETLFEKHLVSIGESSHFVTQYFRYYFSTRTFLLQWGLILVFIIYVLVISKLALQFSAYAIILLVPIIYLAFKFCQNIVNHYLKSKNVCLQLSRGKNEFKYGIAYNMVTYLKSDIVNIEVHSMGGSNSANKTTRTTSVYHIIFKNNIVIKLSAMVIDIYSLINKFPGVEITYKKEYFPLL